MEALVTLIQIVLALGVLNVWLVRYRRPSGWRGGNARTMTEEFQAYGLPGWLLGIVGALKLACAAMLLAGIWLPNLAAPAAILLGLLMAGAMFMHFKIGDPLMKSLPASTMLILSVVVVSMA